MTQSRRTLAIAGEAPDRLDTSRLLGRRISRADLEDFKGFYGDAAVIRCLSPAGQPYAPDAAERLFDEHMAHWVAHRFGTWIFRDADGRFVGRAGLRSMELDDGPAAELFYGVASALWDRGYATEAARAIVSLAFGPLGLKSLVAFTLPTNAASKRVLAKCGFDKVGALTQAGLRHDMFELVRSSPRPSHAPGARRPIRVGHSVRTP